LLSWVKEGLIKKNKQTFGQVAEWAYVASSLDLTYSPAVTAWYFAGVPGDTQVGIGCRFQTPSHIIEMELAGVNEQRIAILIHFTLTSRRTS
jgi:hypothetical protein